ncbi:hypothetical protein HDIA_1966 [Hartmannibacter diazotrophicus]|uniref:Uncharacterized protein n=1 Tax=Hartmannibacter diazotrophicus TaxID=1482074 RepID=A0A2C9D5A2_9HYPH|nr:hypothetical protein HDIA_1966 [Hartmannibacter diazotrophicus]
MIPVRKRAAVGAARVTLSVDVSIVHLICQPSYPKPTPIVKSRVNCRPQKSQHKSCCLTPLSLKSGWRMSLRTRSLARQSGQSIHPGLTRCLAASSSSAIRASSLAIRSRKSKIILDAGKASRAFRTLSSRVETATAHSFDKIGPAGMIRQKLCSRKLLDEFSRGDAQMESHHRLGCEVEDEVSLSRCHQCDHNRPSLTAIVHELLTIRLAGGAKSTRGYVRQRAMPIDATRGELANHQCVIRDLLVGVPFQPADAGERPQVFRHISRSRLLPSRDTLCQVAPSLYHFLLIRSWQFAGSCLAAVLRTTPDGGSRIHSVRNTPCFRWDILAGVRDTMDLVRPRGNQNGEAGL